MTIFRQSFTKLVAAQFVCLAFGLWAQDRLLIACAAWESSTQRSTSGASVESSAIGSVDSSGLRDEQISGELLLAWLPYIRGFSLVWVGGLQAAAAYLILSRVHGEFARARSHAQAAAWQNEHDLLKTRDAVIFGLAKLTESRDPDTGHHLERIALYSTCLAKALRRDPRYRSQITPAFVDSIGISSALHDIGKVGVADTILNKPGRLNRQERERMKDHATLGGQCIQEIELRLGSSNFLSMARQIALAHHERWDGFGYPSGLAGEEIPLAARIVAIVDVYDALSSRRVYKEAFPHQECLAIIRGEAGRQFDPHVAEVFLRIETEIEAIARRYAELPSAGKVQSAERDSGAPAEAASESPQTLIELIDETLRECAKIA
jgi:HD-GYP domain-containing protein (c-di-GMP phosphodiesterase class II)